MPNTWQDIAVRKQKERTGRIPTGWLLSADVLKEAGNKTSVLDMPRKSGLLSNDELCITEDYDATALVAELGSGRLSSVDVINAFSKRAAIAQQLVNCLTETFFNDALARAQFLDDHLKRTGKPIGPLHGLPISLKDTFKVKGYDASVGCAAFCFKPAMQNSALVDLLFKLGAILYCKTNVPLTMMALDSHNNVFGRTLNPANMRLTAGGSSGGEGALLALQGSILGIGTDVGGSIRIPAMCNGLVGVKPSHGRVPYAGQEGGMPAGSSKLGIEATAGPIARSVRDCELLLSAIGNGRPELFDADVIAQTWEQQTSLRKSPTTRAQKPLRVGIVRTDGHVMPLPPIQRLLDDVANILRSPALPSWSPIEVVEVDITDFGPQVLKVFNGVMSIDGGNAWFDNIEATGEPLSPWLSTRLRRRPTKPLDEVRKLQAQKLELQMRFQDVWRESGGYWGSKDSKAKKGDKELDIIICPIAPHPVPLIDTFNSTNYTSAFNLLDVAAGVLPVRTFTEADTHSENGNSKPLNGWDKINRELWNGDRRSFVGGSMSIQVLVPRLMERKLIESMAVLEKALEPLRGNDGKAERSRL
ncbi:hypothetical protein LTR62_001058 [Meristemomyces frigidus]|uniref:amidase n=1 Tax=Meristemomyces frigidus TaxID=1508187 RepID=A0AAN7T8B2_9PEZI|nr:hypothetical protein LTR62_001058 [Meristemomyces frigidus]